MRVLSKNTKPMCKDTLNSLNNSKFRPIIFHPCSIEELFYRSLSIKHLRNIYYSYSL